MSRGDPERVAGFEARHAAILARTLRWADDAAARQDYAQAVHWVETVRGLGHDLPAEYEAKRDMRLNAIDRDRPAHG
ncbi:MAG: hypothetical protein ACLP4R_03845 [Solirubrobacteraceae bacterium]